MRETLSRAFLCALLLGPMLGSPPVAVALDCTPEASYASAYRSVSLARIRLTSSTVDLSKVQAGGDLWNNACNSFLGLDIPYISVGGTADVTIDVILHPGGTDTRFCPPESNCACTSIIWPDGSGGWEDGVIHLFEKQLDGVSDCSPYTPNNIAHELGHSLGLEDVEKNCLSHCTDDLMGASLTAIPTSTECSATDDIWSVPGETNEGDNGTGGTCG